MSVLYLLPLAQCGRLKDVPDADRARRDPVVSKRPDLYSRVDGCARPERAKSDRERTSARSSMIRRSASIFWSTPSRLRRLSFKDLSKGFSASKVWMTALSSLRV